MCLAGQQLPGEQRVPGTQETQEVPRLLLEAREKLDFNRNLKEGETSASVRDGAWWGVKVRMVLLSSLVSSSCSRPSRSCYPVIGRRSSWEGALWKPKMVKGEGPVWVGKGELSEPPSLLPARAMSRPAGQFLGFFAASHMTCALSGRRLALGSVPFFIQALGLFPCSRGLLGIKSPRPPGDLRHVIATSHFSL